MKPLCMDCLHCCQRVTYYPSQFGIGTHVHYGDERCALTDAVYGNGRAGDFCTMERSALGQCGPEGSRFEPEPPPPPPAESTPPRRRWWNWRRS